MRRVLLALVVFSLVVASCGDDSSQEEGLQLIASDLERATPAAGADDIAAAARAQQEFAAALYAILAAESDDDLVFSPASIHIALAMTLAGAEGDTEAQLAEALGFAGMDSATLHDAMNALDALLESRNREEPPQDDIERKVELSIVNALWGQSGFEFQQAFLDTLAVNYGAGMRVVDYRAAAEQARQEINAWVAEQTGDRIRDLLPEGAVDELTRLVLTNAVYLDASWAIPFSPDSTSDETFTLLDGTEVQAPTMHGMMQARYAHGDGWQAVELDYVGNELSMLVILPDQDRFDEVEARLAAGLVAEVRAALDETQVRLALPTFEITTQADLNAALSALGVVDAFDPGRADFTGISTEEQLYVSGVVHQAFIAVDEAGTEAAAATAVVVGTTSMPTDVVDLEVDRPFLFVLHDRETGAPLFMGRVLDPR